MVVSPGVIQKFSCLFWSVVKLSKKDLPEKNYQQQKAG
jgi:hypothetical protein